MIQTEPTENIEVIQETTVVIEEHVEETIIMEETGTYLEESNSEKIIEIPVSETIQIEVTEITVTIGSEQKEESQVLKNSAKSEPEPKEFDQPTKIEEDKFRGNLFQKFLKKLRPKDHS
jgi:hypothetical protein